jgi:hypothetical protein
MGITSGNNSGLIRCQQKPPELAPDLAQSLNEFQHPDSPTKGVLVMRKTTNYPKSHGRN